MFEYIGIDWGEKICGLAFGDLDTGLIIPATTETKTTHIIEFVAKEVSRRQSKYIIVGKPMNFHGKNTLITDKVEIFVSLLGLALPGISIQMINERGTTKDSLAKLGKYHKYQLDNQSAAEILTQYFAKKIVI